MSVYGLLLTVSAGIAFVGAVCRLAHVEHARNLRGHTVIGGLVLIALGMLARIIALHDAAALLASMGLALFFASERREGSR